MRAVVPEGQAQVGDVLRLPSGELREVVAVIGAGDLIEMIVERDIALHAPNFLRDSIAGTCALHGSTTGREKRNHDRWKAKQQPVALRKEPAA